MALVVPQTHVKTKLPCLDNFYSSHGDCVICHIISDDILCKDPFIFQCFGDYFYLHNRSLGWDTVCSRLGSNSIYAHMIISRIFH